MYSASFRFLLYFSQTFFGDGPAGRPEKTRPHRLSPEISRESDGRHKSELGGNSNATSSGAATCKRIWIIALEIYMFWTAGKSGAPESHAHSKFCNAGLRLPAYVLTTQ
jgi:hypothetical protein